MVSTPTAFKEDIIIYPNPSTGIFNISGLRMPPESAIEIYGFSGERVRAIPVSGIDFTLDLSDLPTGAYWARWPEGRQTRLLKLVKM